MREGAPRRVVNPKLGTLTHHALLVPCGSARPCRLAPPRRTWRAPDVPIVPAGDAGSNGRRTRAHTHFVFSMFLTSVSLANLTKVGRMRETAPPPTPLHL